jgi:endonuclease/exonuclease/phosphatase family metal-dependent hydrolase
VSVPIRLMTYNVHGCIGLDGKHAPERIVDVVARAQPDVVALQEVYSGDPRHGNVDQPAVIAEALGMAVVFGPARETHPGQYGNAVLSRHPLRLMRAAALPHLLPAHEARAALHVIVGAPDFTLDVVNTHLGLRRGERALQTRALIEEWLAQLAPGARAVLCGDLNAVPGSRAYGACAAVLRDAQVCFGARVARTWPSFLPVRRLDHVFLGRGLDVTRVEVPRARADRMASDHLPVVVDLLDLELSESV